MTTSEQAALLARHQGDKYGYCDACYECSSSAFIPCDVHLMAELKDAEIAKLRAEIERLREQIAMDDFAKNTTPGGTWIERGEDA